MDGWITTAEAAQKLGVTHSRVRAMVGSGLLESEKRGRDLFVSEASVQTQRSDYGALSTATRIKVLVRDRLTCQKCRTVSEDPSEMHVHHRVARKDDGTNAPENLEALCCDCHRAVHAKVGEGYGKTLNVRLKREFANTLTGLAGDWNCSETKAVERMILEAYRREFGEEPQLKDLEVVPIDEA